MFKIKIVDLSGFTDAEERSFLNAVKLTEKVMNSQQFKTAVLNYVYTYVKTSWFFRKQTVTSPRFAYTDLTNEEVYRLYMMGHDNSDGEDNEMDLWVQAYYSNNGVVGSAYVGPNASNARKFNKKFMGSVDYMAGNIIHEYGHRLGLGHPGSATALRAHSVPYATGEIGRILSKKSLAGMELTPIENDPMGMKLWLTPSPA